MILCCGEALIDMLPCETPAGGPALTPLPGGAVFNTAIALGRLGAPTGFFSGLSTDLFGEMLKDSLEESEVDVAHSVFSDRPTTLAFVRLVDGQAAYTFYDEYTAGRMLSPEDLPPTLPTEITALFLGGISLVVEPCGSAYQVLMEREAKCHFTMLDPNIRSSFIADESAYRTRISQMMSIADIVKLSEEDMSWLYGDGSLQGYAHKVLNMGPKLVCVTQGEKGAHAYTENTSVRVEAPPVKTADTVGAGDTFNAGFLAMLNRLGALEKTSISELDEATIREALALGIRAAAITVSRVGANPPWSHEL